MYRHRSLGFDTVLNSVQNLLNRRSLLLKLIPMSYGDIEVQTIFDTENDHYQLVSVGWNGNRRIHGCVLHLNVKNGKIWIQHDGTEEGVANELMRLGVPKDQIVLAFHSPYKRQFTGFAVE